MEECPVCSGTKKVKVGRHEEKCQWCNEGYIEEVFNTRSEKEEDSEE